MVNAKLKELCKIRLLDKVPSVLLMVDF